MARTSRRHTKARPVSQPVERLIHVIRGRRVMFDADLARLYDVPTKTLNQAVSRNVERFPEDFAFRLSKDELENWRSQIVTSNPSVKMGLRRPPYAFTEHGVAMLSSVLKSEQALIATTVLVSMAVAALSGAWFPLEAGITRSVMLCGGSERVSCDPLKSSTATILLACWRRKRQICAASIRSRR